MNIKLSIFLFSLLLSFWTSAQTTDKLNNTIATRQIHEEQYVPINGIEQWVTINGNLSKPVILFLHGGPGSPITPYIDVLYKDLEKDFIIVQWDQRGSGRTYGHNNPPEELTPEYLKNNPLTLEQMTSDGIVLSQYLLQHLGKKKIILSGTSWGSALGVKIATKAPELFYAYVGHSQIVNPNFSIERYSKLYKIAEERKDNDALQILNTIGKPPYSIAKNTGMLYRVIKKYEKANSTPAPGNWFVLAPEYDNEKDSKNREDSDDYSFVNFVGDQKLGVQSMGAPVDMMKDNLDFKIPVYLIQGEEDILTPKEMSKKYFDALKAPKKEYFLLPKAAHGFNQSVVDTQYKIFRSIKTD
ncbi:MAG: alpha/beta hydrolase [Candidatus Chryseobacterium colombiense]|nr:alpha/beta hydrolase [Chryseobacterium sp.]WEK68695.1 MAG: alpha/beta hydrolase [Chryseobacterium sp.]